ncbi:MAG: hypothetical protein K8S87_04025, partial [Planctomycetes bacterium]|nr:hypothetical protein [Planctomycetota bacterium]
IQFAKDKDYAYRSNELTSRVIDDTVKIANRIDFKDVIKPHKLNVTGFFAVAFSLILTGTVYFTMTLPKHVGIAFNLDFPDNITKYNINYHVEPSDDLNFRDKFTIGEDSDVVIRAVPKAYRFDRVFNILDYDVPQIFFRNLKSNVVRKFRMSQGFDEKGRKVYEYVENKVALGNWEVFVKWEEQDSLKYMFNVRPAPTIIESIINYKAPEHMRPSEVLLFEATESSEQAKAQIDTLSGIGFTITLPKRDEKGNVIFDKFGKPNMSDIRRYISEIEFENALPDIYENYVRGKVEKWSDTINEIESTEVSIKLKLNKKLNLDKSRLIIFHKQESNINTPPSEYKLRLVENNAVSSKENTKRTHCAYYYYQIYPDFKLQLNMVKYQFLFEDIDHLHQNEIKSHVINVQKDQRPFARFVYTGSSLREGASSERLVTPTGFIPLVLEARDDFGINSIRLLYTVNGMTKKQREIYKQLREKSKSDINENIKNLYSAGESKSNAVLNLIEYGNLALPEISKAIDETKNSNVRLLLTLIKQKITLRDVPEFDELTIFTDQPTNPPNIKFTIQVEKLLSEDILASITDDTSMSLTFVIEVEDNRKNLVQDLINGKLADTHRGQTFKSEPLTISLVTLQTLQREIRSIMRKIVKIKISKLIFKQLALLKATNLFHEDPSALRLNKETKRGGIAFSTIFEDEVVRKDAEGDEVRYDGQAIGRMQDEISRIADGLVYRLDSIVRHYKNNLDLEKGETKSPQQNTIQRIKIFLNLISMSKELAFEINPDLKKLENDPTRINWILRRMLNETTGLESVLPSFDALDFSRTLVSMDIIRASVSREAALAYEEVISPDNIDNFERVRDLLKQAKGLQTTSLDVFEECMELMKEWDEFEEHKQALKRILDAQTGIGDAINDLLKD